MTTRRQFLTQTTLGGTAAVFLPLGCTPNQDAKGGSPNISTSMPKIKSVIRREETLLRLGGNGDNFHMSWAADDKQYVSLCDGSGFSDTFKANYNTRMFTVEGSPDEAKFSDVPDYPTLAFPQQGGNDPRYYGFGTLALDGHIYQYLSTFNKKLSVSELATAKHIPDSELMRFNGVKLIYSPDNGRTWLNQNGSGPVSWEGWDNRSLDSMVFLDEDQDAFSLLTVLQMGRNYEHNKDGFIYVYAPNGNTDGTMNELVMFRVPKTKLLDRSSYEFFAGLTSTGPSWSHDIFARKPVHTFPRGWVNRLYHPYSWHPSVVYNAPLGVYMMANWGFCSDDANVPMTGIPMKDIWFSKPSYLGLWISRNPWGPWTQIHEETSWMPGGDANARAYQPQVAPKWISEDGKSLWLVWTDFQMTDREVIAQATQAASASGAGDWSMAHEAMKDQLMRKYMPYYSFNTQRIDLEVA